MQDNDHNETKIVWIPDDVETFVQGEILNSNDNDSTDETSKEIRLLNSNEIKTISINDIQPVNPISFEKSDNMSELTFLNEPSVLHNLENRYKDDLIYTYSGLFLVAINPYCNIKLYTPEFINLYHGSVKEENKPHIFAIAEEAYQNLLTEKLNQSILVTGESGAGKTENTKKILQYLAAVTSSDDKETISNSNNNLESFERKILQSNPILESFGNAQTVRNNNSSRFGKFIKIEFDERGKINGAHIEWYLLEKSRVINQHPDERNYHIFYEFLNSVSEIELNRKYHLPSNSISSYEYLAHSNHSIAGVNDQANFTDLLTAFQTVGFKEEDIENILKVIAIILHIGNIKFTSEKSEQASFSSDIEDLITLLGIEKSDFETAILRPKSKAGREWVSQSKNATQARFILNSLARSLYEHLFSYIVDRINLSLDHGSMTVNYIGLLDIAGFEIFEHNSFEQLCINYTNEKLQQFFNHHMFVLEQSEYIKENIQWNYIDYGKDLQFTIDLIEQKKIPSGILPLLDEESILPKSTDDTFFEKLITNWDQKSDRFKRSKLPNCFILKHYAGDVEYNINSWLSKNKDPLNENLSTVLSNANNSFISNFFAKNENDSDIPGSPVKSPKARAPGTSFRTTSARHREQQISLLQQLGTTHPHFVRCIIPNNKKMAKNFDRKLILDQLRCNGVLEGIRIAREGYPNRIFFKEFFNRYNLLSSDQDDFHKKDPKKNCEILLSSLHLDPSLFKVGNTKLFFKAGVLAKLENKKEEKMKRISVLFNAQVRGRLVRRSTRNKLQKITSARVIGNTFETYNNLMQDPWFNLFVTIKPLLSSTQDITKTKKFSTQIKELETKVGETEKINNELLSSKVEVETQLKDVRDLLAEEKNKLDTKEKELEEILNAKTSLETQLSEVNKLNDHINIEKKNALEKYESSKTEIEKMDNLIKEREIKIETLTSNADELSKKFESFKMDITSKEEQFSVTKQEKDDLLAKIQELEQLKLNNEKEISNLKNKIANSEEDLDIKLGALEKSCETAKNRLETLVNENVDLRSQIGTAKKEQVTYSKQIKNKENELNRFKDRLVSFQNEVAFVSKQRDDALTEHEKVLSELKDARSKLSELKISYQTLENNYTSLKEKHHHTNNSNNSIKSSSVRVQDLENKLSEERSLNQYLTKRLSVGNENFTADDILSGTNMKTNELIHTYNDMKLKLDDTIRKLEEEIEEKKTLISTLRITETRLASSSFDYQRSKGQIKKLIQIIKNSNIEVDLEKELDDNSNVDISFEKLVLEVQYLRRQLEVEKKAHKDAENVASALHSKFGKMQSAGSSSDLYKLKYEASEEHVKNLEYKLKENVLHDRTNLAAGDIFKNRKGISKYEEELRYQKLENYKIQEYLGDSEKQINNLTFEIKQFKSKETLLNEQIQRLEQELSSTIKQKEMIAGTMKQQKQQYETCLNDLHANEVQIKDYTHALKQAEDDVKSLGSVLENLKSQIKQKEKQLWTTETERNDLDMKLQETVLRLKREQDVNKMLNSDLEHMKERVIAMKDNTHYSTKIESLNEQIEQGIKNESEYKKQISTLKYKLESLGNDTEAKINDLIKQNNHYTNLVEVLSTERDAADAERKDLDEKYTELTNLKDTLASKIQLLTEEKLKLMNQVEQLNANLDQSGVDFSKSVQERNKINDNIQYLEETLALQKEQNERNIELVKSLQNDLDSYREKFDQEKQKNIDLHEENQSMSRKNEKLNETVQGLQEQISDTTDKDSWLAKIHELEALVSSETDLKYEEMKKNKTLDRTVQELRERNESQVEVINLANKDRQQFENNVQRYNDQINNLEKFISEQEVNLKKAVRDNSYYQDRVLELEKELAFWKERSDGSVGNIDRKQVDSDIRTEEIMS
ncbi:similar to Saccharomyces cerevisiae YHR023W MYO1 Type II myosin heavy chain, required for wild-type cytokinesis and cell separation [Maudiozyma saulgeensis]|uniref:Similar to Saccharomyces cerevisiae YHR023W MYO1 Type II myosin heavy chain, required for wild-type cytokinesis and cell separation n=1 Tax=Maudiozyma saulgeensis TaxID=1789683 RepID=A0A1X7R5S5_9SACH|nr:similar to Saccharomyces cerevisiae YHR023W MYO1 Type II myosin heavy chain, required for wild-type cytokinesis and cell separation [Kazachstania saulgeensis]